MSAEQIPNGETAPETSNAEHPTSNIEPGGEKKVNDELWRIELALTKAGGDRGKAAAMLKMGRRKLNQKILHTAALRDRWMKKDALQSPAVTIDREPIQFRPRGTFRKQPTDAEIEAAVKREDAKFKEGLSGLRLNPEEMDLAIALQKFQQKHFKRAADLIGGGISMAALKLLGLMETLGTRLKNQEGFKGETAVQEEAMCWQAYLGICAELRKMGHFVSDAGFKKALIELRSQEVKQGTGRGRPGFGPLQKTEVHLHTEKSVSGQLKVLHANGSADQQRIADSQ